MTINRISVDSVFSAIPFVIFAYMYQPCVPQIYHELKDKSLANISKVLAYGTGIATIAYVLVGLFGYVTFAMRPNVDQLFA